MLLRFVPFPERIFRDPLPVVDDDSFNLVLSDQFIDALFADAKNYRDLIRWSGNCRQRLLMWMRFFILILLLKSDRLATGQK
jgi:hypothetical protein